MTFSSEINQVSHLSVFLHNGDNGIFKFGKSTFWVSAKYT